jgi:quercetin 2,3-dioxygenase
MNNPTTTLFPAASRGMADHGWLVARHSFSFASYYDQQRINFGALRVLNDDTIAGGKGFGMHPHDNMEIITIPLSGAIFHKDSMGNEGLIKAGEIQVMSAGTGILHSEFNALPDQELKLFQIWVIPNKRNVQPRYAQRPITELKPNELLTIVEPYSEDAETWIHQNAWFHLGEFDGGKSIRYSIHDPEKNGVYAIVVDGSFDISGNILKERDALGIENAAGLEITCLAKGRILLLEVPMYMDHI